MSVIILSVPMATSCALPASSDSAARLIEPRTTPNSMPTIVDVERRVVARVALDRDPLGVHDEAGDAALGLVDDLAKRVLEHEDERRHQSRSRASNSAALDRARALASP